jgi:hypothetical protein
MKFLFIIGSLLFLLVSCDPSVRYDRIIQNDSNHGIWIISPDSINSCQSISFDSILIPSNTTHKLETYSEIAGLLSQFENCNHICTDTLDTRITTNDSLKLNVGLESANPLWEYRIIKPGKAGVCECRLTITDTDIH